MSDTQTTKEFGRRLYQLMLSKGWRQSELARQANLQRNAVSTYILGKALPTQANLQKLADALGVQSHELLAKPSRLARNLNPPITVMQLNPAKAGTAWLHINQLVSTPIAIKVMVMLQEEADRAQEIDPNNPN